MAELRLTAWNLLDVPGLQILLVVLVLPLARLPGSPGIVIVDLSILSHFCWHLGRCLTHVGLHDIEALLLAFTLAVHGLRIEDCLGISIPVTFQLRDREELPWQFLEQLALDVLAIRLALLPVLATLVSILFQSSTCLHTVFSAANLIQVHLSSGP